MAKSNEITQSVCLFFQAHQPLRIKKYDFFQIGEDFDYFDHAVNEAVLNRVCDRSYLPALALFEKLHEKTNGKFAVGLGLSGSLIEQLEQYRPDVLSRFQEVVGKGIAHLTGGTYSHSIAAFFSVQEVSRQVQLHKKMLWKYFRKRPKTFANTELIYRDDMVPMIKAQGFTTILAEGVERYLGYRSPNYLYHPEGDDSVKLLLRNGGLSDDVGFRFANPSWNEYPLTAGKFLNWIKDSTTPLHNIFLDLETIGEHQGAETGIFDFWEALITEGFQNGIRFENPSAAIKRHKVAGSYSSPKHSSWADQEKDKSAWQSNVMQQEASQKLFRLQQYVNSSGEETIINRWTHLQSADSFLYMSTKGGEAGEVHHRFSHIKDPYDTYSYFMNILADLQLRSKAATARNYLRDSAGLSV